MEQRTFYSALGGRIADRRGAKNMTQAALSERIGIPRARLASIESGRQSIHVHQLVEIANALGVKSIEALLPANFWLPANSGVADAVEFTGSALSAEQKRQIAGIFDSLGD